MWAKMHLSLLHVHLGLRHAFLSQSSPSLIQVAADPPVLKEADGQSLISGRIQKQSKTRLGIAW